MRIHCLQHVPFEGPAAIGDWAHERGHKLTITRLDRGQHLPAIGTFDWLLVMGGPMGVADRDSTIATRLHGVRDRIAAACARAGRGPGEVTLPRATRTQPAEAVASAVHAGPAEFGPRPTPDSYYWPEGTA